MTKSTAVDVVETLTANKAQLHAFVRSKHEKAHPGVTLTDEVIDAALSGKVMTGIGPEETTVSGPTETTVDGPREPVKKPWRRR